MLGIYLGGKKQHDREKSTAMRGEEKWFVTSQD
jgi:hypothetical protein